MRMENNTVVAGPGRTFDKGVSFKMNPLVNVNVINKSKHDLPFYATEASAGADIKANIDAPITLKPLERVLVPTGIYIALPKGFEAKVRPSSGLAYNQGLQVRNSPVTLDSEYRGAVKVLVVSFYY